MVVRKWLSTNACLAPTPINPLNHQRQGNRMTPESVMTLGRHAMEVTLMIAAPLLLVSLIIGLVVSIFQAATQINESTLSFIPKLVGIFVALVVAGPWMLSVMLDYMRQLFTGIPALVG
jgi:flagellar biosynthetic protein FliQ